MSLTASILSAHRVCFAFRPVSTIIYHRMATSLAAVYRQRVARILLAPQPRITYATGCAVAQIIPIFCSVDFTSLL